MSEVDQLFERAEAEHGESVIREVMSILVSSRVGLEASELAVLLPAVNMPSVPALVSKTQPWRISEERLADAIRARYLWRESDRRLAHTRLADLHLQSADPSGDGTWTAATPRALSEIPWQLAQAHDHARLSRTLLSFPFLAAK